MLPARSRSGRPRPARPVRRRLLAAAAAAAAFTAGVGPAPVARAGTDVLYVDGPSRGGQCSDSRTAAANSITAPWCTIAKAIQLAPAGSTILVRAGTYPRLQASGVARTEEVTITRYPGERPTVAGMTLQRVQRLRFQDLDFNAGSIITESRHLRLVGNRVDVVPSKTSTPSGFIVRSLHDSVIASNLIRDVKDGVNMIDSTTPSARVLIKGNHFDHPGNDAIHIAPGISDVQIVENEFDTVRPRSDIDPYAHADSIQAMGTTRNILVARNHVHDGRGFLFMVSPEDQQEAGAGHYGLVVENNLLVTTGFALRTFSLVDSRIVNNTIWGLTSGANSGLTVWNRTGSANAPTTGLILANNIIKQFDLASDDVGFARHGHQLVASGPATGTNDISGSPAFVDAAGRDFRLRPSSPGVDAGLDEVAPALDHDGNPRVGAPDIGAFEVPAGAG